MIFFLKWIIVFTTCNDEKFKAWKRFKKIENSINKDVRNIFRIKKEIDDNTVKDIKNIFRLKKKIKPLKIEWLETTFLSLKKNIIIMQ